MSIEDLKTQGARLRWAWNRAGFKTAKEAADAAGLPDVNFRALQNDQHKLNKHATVLSKAFGVSVRWLLEGGSEETQDLHPASAVCSIFPRISADPAVFDGKPTIEGTRVKVADVLEMLAESATSEGTADLSHLGGDEIIAALRYAARRCDQPVVF